MNRLRHLGNCCAENYEHIFATGFLFAFFLRKKERLRSVSEWETFFFFKLVSKRIQQHRHADKKSHQSVSWQKLSNKTSNLSLFWSLSGFEPLALGIQHMYSPRPGLSTFKSSRERLHPWSSEKTCALLGESE